ncbi:MAG: ribosomal protein S18-alanine N-acetyltransferase [Eubacteriales bacterium]|nr:ribosomal protein S18-alanine N-acetyltransferase [Eubacteriales bacterium]
MKIEKFALQYLDDVADIERICFAHPWSKQDLKNQLDLDTSHFLVAVEDGRAVGYMGLQIFSGEGYVTNVAVLPQYRQLGIAKALIDKALQNDMCFITLEVRESNTPAIRLYEKAGFKNVGTRPNFYTDPAENAIIMTMNTVN